MSQATPRRTVVEVPWRTILKLIAAVVLVWLWLQLWSLLLLLLVAVLLAVTLDPVVRRLEGRLPRWAAATVVSFALLAVVCLFLWFTWESLASQARFLSQHLTEVGRAVSARMPSWIRSSMTGGQSSLGSSAAPYAIRFVRSLLSAAVVIVLAFIVMLYLLIEGQRTRDWLMAFVPVAHRGRAARTLAESQRVIFGYVAGNIATSIFAAVFVVTALSILKVPAALLLALIAGVCDFIPVLGFIVSSIPAILLALTVSTHTALWVIGCYITYHAIENYLIAPRVYGDRLKLSNLAVVLAFAVGAELAGIIGALIALPLAAAYPAIERIWLREQLPETTVAEHRAIEHRRAG